MLKLLLMPFVTCMGNPFLEDSDDLTLDTIDIGDEEVVMSITNVYNTGRDQYTLFVQERLRDQKKIISDPIKRTNYSFPKRPRAESTVKLLLWKKTVWKTFMVQVKPRKVICVQQFQALEPAVASISLQI